jgi:hypothetical protein
MALVHGPVVNPKHSGVFICTRLSISAVPIRLGVRRYQLRRGDDVSHRFVCGFGLLSGLK